ncbi:MAG TPA: hypothetical protein VMD91_09075 [Candidatus Sulfotelmatobacter sp.]|nr:hypothetical protein [Candidatus Sulfotelmatobacter sp.]
MTRAGPRDRAAVALSLALHASLLTVLAILTRSLVTGAAPESPISYVSLLHIARPAVQPAHVPRPVPPHAAPVRRPAVVIHRIVLAPAPQAARPDRAAPVKPAADNPVASSARSGEVGYGAPEQSAAAPPVAATPLPAPTPAAVAAQAAATPAPRTTATDGGDQQGAGVGNFGETYQPALAPDVRASVVSGVARGFLIEIQVDENGHATGVTFVRGPADPAVREELRTRLLAASYIPATCNGLRCTGTFDLQT